MKTSRPAAAQEECGVWLDTIQLKGKAKQKRQARPISKLLNPFSEGAGYNMAVALNFTQTKIEMPKTKQSSISTFFAPQRRVINKMTSCQVPSTDNVQHSSSSTSSTCSLTAHKPAAVGMKRRREIDLDFYAAEPDSEGENVTEPEAAEWQEEAAGNVSSPDIHCDFGDEQFEENNPPQRKRRLTSTSFLVDSQPPPQAWSQDPLLTYSQYSDFDPSSQKNTTTMNFSEPSFFNGLQSEEAFGIQMDLEGRTSTQKPFKPCDSSHFNNDKENSLALISNSPTKDLPLLNLGPSNRTWTEPKTASPRKHIAHMQTKLDEEESVDSQFKWTKPNCSPVKKLPRQPSCRATEEDSLSMLFTQDSEGFRVIAHRGLQTRSPLKDQSNISTRVVRSSAVKSVVEDEEEEGDHMLFTQDSQGNLVIKH